MVRDRPRIVLDARPLLHPQAGGFRAYVRALVHGLQERGTDDLDLILYVDRPPVADVCDMLPGAGWRVLSPDRLKTDTKLFREQARADKPDLIHGTVNYLPAGLSDLGAALTVTIHDAMGVKSYPWDKGVPRTLRERFINRYWAYRTRASARAASRVVTVSHGSASELEKALRLPAEKLEVIYASLTLPPPDPATPRPHEPHILALASPDPRKNLRLLFRALHEERRRFPGGRIPCLGLVCAGEAAKRHVSDLAARWPVRHFPLPEVGDQMLSDLYSVVDAFIWPSYREGFGLPPVEAMWAGCRVAASNAPVMPEVLGAEAPVYFDPDDPAGLADALIALLTEGPEARLERIRAGREHASRYEYTPRRMAEETARLWKSVLGA